MLQPGPTIPHSGAGGPPNVSEDNHPAEHPRLLPLTPGYEAENHKVYLDAVEAALTREDADSIRNIALTGSYGTGKSSVLLEVAANHKKKVMRISLSTLGIEDAQDDDSAAKSKTNRIQKEIVKQFLYSEDPARAPGSRFRRIGRLNLWHEVPVALLLGLVVAIVFLLTGWTETLLELTHPYLLTAEPGFALPASLVVWLVASGFVLAMRYLTHHRLRIEKVTAGPATISLAEESTSYFDRYLDEIVYFFDVTAYDIVIFEDIDRFDDPHIFETLRALNTLLNGAHQLKGRRIRFIYAIKDSIFDELGLRAAREEGANSSGTDAALADAAEAELARANRTKFFDLVIPIVPFITHVSARDLMGKVLNDIEHEISNELIDVTARHLADMRFVKNARNEFVIFRQKVLATSAADAEKVENNEGLDLNEDSLFAMMLYKGTHLTDFEQIRLGNSKLDLLYKASRNLVTENVARLDGEARALRARIANLDSVDTRSERLGMALQHHIERSVVQVVPSSAPSFTMTFAGQPITPDGLHAADFWTIFVTGAEPITVAISGLSVPRVGAITVPLTITRATAAEVLGDPLSLEDWQAEDRDELPSRLERIRRERDFLLQADMGELISRPDLVVSDPDEDLAKTSQPAPTQSKVSLAVLSQRYLKSTLAQKLVAAGYINRDFTLYSSTYYNDRVSTRARNFLMHNIDPNVPDFHFTLTPQDVDALLGERDKSVLSERGSYNIAILDRLLETHDERADLLTGALSAFGEAELAFLQAYLAGGHHAVALIGKIASRSVRVFKYLVQEAEVDAGKRAELVNAALLNLNPDLDYVLGEGVKDYFEGNYISLATFTRKRTDRQTAVRITTLLTSMDGRLRSLRPLAPEVLRAVVEESRYSITRDNLLAALGEEASLALDAVKGANESVYDYLLANHAAYLAALNEDEPTIQSNDMFVEVIEDVVELAPTLLPEAVQRAAADCVVTDLASVTPVAWPILAMSNRFPASFENVTGYIASVGRIDQNLAVPLAESRAILRAEDGDQGAKLTLAAQLLAAGAVLPAPELRADLVVSLALDGLLPASAVEPEDGRLLGLLLKHQLIADDATSFTLALGQDWPTREFAISESQQFATYMTPNEVPVGDVARLLRSMRVPAHVKEKVIENIVDYTVAADSSILQAVAEYAVGSGLQIPVAEVGRYASAGVPSRLVVRLLEPHLAAIDLDELAPILLSLGTPYSVMTERNGRHPRLPNTPADVALVERLKEVDVVSSYDANQELLVHMRGRSGFLQR